MLKFSLVIFYVFFNFFSFAQAQCIAPKREPTAVVDLGPIKTVAEPLAGFDPCHHSVNLQVPGSMKSAVAGKPPLVIIIHGGSGVGIYEREFSKLMIAQGYATLLFDAFEMNGFLSNSDLIQYQLSNGARQRMIYKVAIGAYHWVRGHEKIDNTRIFIQGLSNGGTVSINLAGAVDANHVRGVIAEGAPSTGIGFPDKLNVPLLMVYGGADVFGGITPDDFIHLRGNPCPMNELFELAPQGFVSRCNKDTGYDKLSLSPYAWYKQSVSGGNDVQFELVDSGGHGLLFSDFRSYTQRAGRRILYRSHGANASDRERIKGTILRFIREKI